ncbi:MAG: hypothetical protein ACP5RS_02545 [Thermoplasmata archaeon]
MYKKSQQKSWTIYTECRRDHQKSGYEDKTSFQVMVTNIESNFV